MCLSLSYNAIEVGIPQQHGAIVACWRVQVEHQRVSAVLLPADVRHVVTDHGLLRGRVHTLDILCDGERDQQVVNFVLVVLFNFTTREDTV